jgi:hypothetical protein
LGRAVTRTTANWNGGSWQVGALSTLRRTAMNGGGRGTFAGWNGLRARRKAKPRDHPAKRSPDPSCWPAHRRRASPEASLRSRCRIAPGPARGEQMRGHDVKEGLPGVEARMSWSGLCSPDACSLSEQSDRGENCVYGCRWLRRAGTGRSTGSASWS